LRVSSLPRWGSDAERSIHGSGAGGCIRSIAGCTRSATRASRATATGWPPCGKRARARCSATARRRRCGASATRHARTSRSSLRVSGDRAAGPAAPHRPAQGRGHDRARHPGHHPGRTILDLAEQLAPQRLERVVHEAEYRRLTRPTRRPARSRRTARGTASPSPAATASPASRIASSTETHPRSRRSWEPCWRDRLSPP
jgi:hypothetical protein